MRPPPARTPRPRPGRTRARIHAPLALATLPALVVLAACVGSENAARATGLVRTDSAGVEIVVNPASAAAVPVFATLDTVPGLRLGSAGGRPEELFGTVEGVVPLPDGGVAVLDGQAGAIRLFDADGTYRTTIGSKGQGPGELQRPNVLALLPGDTLAVYDARSLRITRFGLDGSLGRITTLDETRGRVVEGAFLPDGRFLGQSRWIVPDGPPPPMEPTLVRDTVVLVLYTPDGAIEDTVDVLPSRESITDINVGDGFVSVMKRPAVFGRTNVFAVHPAGIWSSTNDRFELRQRDAQTGRLLRIVRAPGLEEPATDALPRQILGRALAEEVETAADRRRVEAWYDMSPLPETQPAYDRIVVDDEARLWVRAWSPFEAATRWWAFAADGQLLGFVDVPSGTTIVAVRCGRVWGVEQDELGVSYVVRHDLPHDVRGVEGC